MPTCCKLMVTTRATCGGPECRLLVCTSDSHDGATCTTEELPCLCAMWATGERPPSTVERLCMMLASSHRYAVLASSVARMGSNQAHGLQGAHVWLPAWPIWIQSASKMILTL
jgi:hypothetical protein